MWLGKFDANKEGYSLKKRWSFHLLREDERSQLLGNYRLVINQSKRPVFNISVRPHLRCGARTDILKSCLFVVFVVCRAKEGIGKVV